MKALISPLELVAIGVRIAEVSAQEFPVAEPLYWIDCDSDVNAIDWFFNTETQQCDLIPISVPTANENKQTATTLLQETDWTAPDDVANPLKSNPYLANQSEFLAYRNAVRQYAIYPVEGNIDWPVIPQEVWTKV